MARRPSPKKAKARKDPHLPSREEILAFVSAHPEKATKRDIAKQFKIKGAARIGLKRMLAELIDDGLVERGGRKKLHTPGSLPPVVVADITGRDDDGELIATLTERGPSDEDDENAPVAAGPRILVMPTKRKPAPGVGDRVLLRVDDEERENAGPGATVTAHVIRVLDKPSARILGIYREITDGSGRIEPVDKKNRKEWAVHHSDSKDAREGELVAVEPLKSRKRLGLPQARVIERIGSMADENAVSRIAVETHGIPLDFPRAAIEEAESVKAKTGVSGLEDMRKVPFVTIDPADARDHDDAVFAEADDDPKNPGGHIVWVAIADVSRYVTPGSALDKAARERGNSVYFPGRVVPMLPERLSNDLCSLREKEDRPALAVRMVYDAGGVKTDHRFARIMMKSAAKLRYETAQAAIDGRPNPKGDDTDTGPLLEPVLKPLWAAWKTLLKAQEKRAPLDLDLPERKLVLDKAGKVARVIVPERLEAHRLVETFMIAANVAAAETLEKAQVPLVYRAHDAPSQEKLAALGEFLRTIDISLAKGQTIQPRQFNQILAKVADTPNAGLVNEVILRSQAQAEYTPENYGHFGLNLRRYAHFTSPIRRYADLIVHRALVAALKLGEGGFLYEPEDLAETSAHISMTERRAMAAERETVDRLIAHFLADRVGTRFPGRIAGVTRSGMFVKLNDTGADGYIPAASIDGNYWRYDETGQQLVSDQTGEAFRLGDDVEVRLIEAVPVAGMLRFEILSDGRKLPASERKKLRERTKNAPRGNTRRRAAVRRRR
ncbi:MAG: ribonuclease R [Tepidamorphaceae bacterium]|nr:ribonuclease R [Rhodobiaceae bacterium]MCC0048775.1 ribonuclease R [Rhodobiaceae bacterium]